MSLLTEYRQSVDNLTTLAVADVVGAMRIARDEATPDFAATLRTTLPRIAETYTTAAQVLAVSYYDQSRELANLDTIYEAKFTEYDYDSPVQSGVSYAVSKQVKEQPYESIVSMLAGNMQRVVSGAERSNITFNVATDPEGTTYQRIPSSTACSFCLTMAAVAEFRTSDYFQKFHDNCRCTSRPVFKGQEATELPIFDQVRSAYSLADKELNRRREEVGYYSLRRRAAAEKWPDLTLTTKNHLRLVRQITGWK